MRYLILVLSFYAMSSSVWAAPISYVVDKSASKLGFVYFLEDDPIQGRFPEFDADLMIDFDSVSQSSINVTLDATKASAGLIFATEAMRSESVLNVAQFPTITFASKAVRLGPNPTVIVSGELTIRGVTQPIEFSAKLVVEDKAQLELRDRLFVELDGSFLRSAFGASGYRDLVEDRMDLKARIAIDRLN